MKELWKVPFLRLLLPLLLGIFCQYYTSISHWAILSFVTGCILMLVSYLIAPKNEYNYRWTFGVGAYFCLFSIGVFATSLRQHQSVFSFQDVSAVYNATIIDLPQQKPQTIAFKVELDKHKKQIVCYLPKDSAASALKVGDCFDFFSKIERFSSLKNSSGFDYAQHMYNKGYAGLTFVRADNWESTGTAKNSIQIKSAQCRQAILAFVQSLGLSQNQYALLSALLLGYQDELSDDVLQSFRATGTAHILSVSGMHVMIIFGVIVLLLFFIPRYSRYFFVKQILVIVLLWLYVFVIGLPASAVRACVMLSVFCVAQMLRVKAFSFNTLFAAAFVMLLYNPLWLFDIGFQLSFAAVLSMCVLQPVFSIKTKSRLLNYPINLFTLSLAAQIGTFPLALYYFGMFPSYFFITNMLIVPLVTVLVYDGLALMFLALFSEKLTGLFISCFRFISDLLIRITHFFEHLPYAVFQNIEISILQVFLLWIIIFSMIYFYLKKQPKVFICSLLSILMLIVTAISSKYENQNTLVVYNNRHSSKIIYYIGYTPFTIDSISANKLLNINHKKYLLLVSDLWKGNSFPQKFELDYLHLTGSNQMSIYVLNELFKPKNVILDATLSRNDLKRYVIECEKLRITYYDVANSGTLRINF